LKLTFQYIIDSQPIAGSLNYKDGTLIHRLIPQL
jgi:hypothetical protein